MTSLTDYFEKTEGLGVLATAAADGSVDLAIYARPHVINDQTIAFIMSDRLSHRNLTTNPHAAYLFLEQTGRYRGQRLYLTKISEETDPAVIETYRRKKSKQEPSDRTASFLVTFRIDRTRPAVGDGPV